MIKLEDVNERGMSFSSPGCEDLIYLTPKEAMESIKEFQKGLFAWAAFMGKRIDDPECH